MAGADVFAPSATAQEQQPRPESIDEQVKRKVDGLQLITSSR